MTKHYGITKLGEPCSAERSWITPEESSLGGEKSMAWKGKGAETKALADPISEIVSQLQTSLIQSNSRGLLSGTSVLLKADAAQTDLLNRACFGRPKVTAEENEQWFQLSME
ncbi:hypothetical protein RND71_020991 [Anisodus tanguticus]|uniref:tRNA intron endonuclease N-terminal domain-containing protein n=1 Tax=Anisodus tanguticus TaxID=243964 RepID=A0AAE1V7W1_9SOLA|nr:hypothetical protein RND71_020991 [Anisodus tanguticus]